MHFKVFSICEERGTPMASSELTLPSGADLVTAEQVLDYQSPPAEGHPVAEATMTPNGKEAQEHRAQHEAPESGKENDCDRPPEDRQFLELLELQKRMFQST
jgi:hypothetical protein